MFSIFLSLLFAAQPPQIVLIHDTNESNSIFWRIPAIATTNKGTVITACDKRNDSNQDLALPIQIAIRRSTDGGFTFSTTKVIAGTGKDYGYSDPSVVVDKKTNVVLIVFNAGNRFQSSTATDRICQCYCISYDDGVTFSDPIDFTNQIYGAGCKDEIRKTWLGVFLTSGGGLCTSKGKIMFAAVIRKPNFGSYPVQAVWTENLGRTWHVGGGVANIADESQIQELSNGTLVIAMRTNPRTFAYSYDEGETWTTPVAKPWASALCNGALYQYTSKSNGFDKDRLLMSFPYGSTSRRNVSLLLSYDDGITFPVEKSIYGDLSAYSSITRAPDGSILLYFEREVQSTPSTKGYRMELARIDLEWLTDGADKYTPPK